MCFGGLALQQGGLQRHFLRCRLHRTRKRLSATLILHLLILILCLANLDHFLDRELIRLEGGQFLDGVGPFDEMGGGVRFDLDHEGLAHILVLVSIVVWLVESLPAS